MRDILLDEEVGSAHMTATTAGSRVARRRSGIPTGRASFSRAACSNHVQPLARVNTGICRHHSTGGDKSTCWPTIRRTTVPWNSVFSIPHRCLRSALHFRLHFHPLWEPFYPLRSLGSAPALRRVTRLPIQALAACLLDSKFERTLHSSLASALTTFARPRSVRGTTQPVLAQ